MLEVYGEIMALHKKVQISLKNRNKVVDCDVYWCIGKRKNYGLRI